MGMYTEFALSAKLYNLPDEIQLIIKYLLPHSSLEFYNKFHLNDDVFITVDGNRDLNNLITLFSEKNENKAIDILKKYEFFKTHQWFNLLKTVEIGELGFSSELIKKDNYFIMNVNAEIKNYYKEIQKFIEWIKPYILYNVFIGFYQYEQDSLPTLIFYNEDIKFVNLELESDYKVDKIIQEIETNYDNNIQVTYIINELKQRILFYRNIREKL